MGVITLRPLTFGLLLFCLGHFVPATFCAQSNCLPLFRLLEIFCLVILSRSSLSPVQKSSLRWYWWSGCRLDFTLKILRSNSSKTDPLPTLRILALCYICMWDVYAQEHYIFEMIKLPIFGTYYLLFAVFFFAIFCYFSDIIGRKRSSHRLNSDPLRTILATLRISQFVNIYISVGTKWTGDEITRYKITEYEMTRVQSNRDKTTRD